MVSKLACLIMIQLVLGLTGSSLAQEPAKQGEKPSPPKPQKPAAKLFQENISFTKHSITLRGGTLDYTARAGYLKMYDESGKHKANIFFVAYEKAGVSDKAKRPITFAFNGGPGSSSVWLHMGALGPRRVVMGDAGEPLPPPYRLADNQDTWLDFTDLVFIDPAVTGYSRPAPGEKKEQFHGVQQDLASVGEFIRLYTTKYQRWLSPKFIAGESYGTTRAAGLSGYLQDRYGMYISGLMLISTILQFQTAQFDVGNDLPFVLFLPTYTSTAWYHKRLAPELQANLARTIDEVRNWAMDVYLLALAKGDTLSPMERHQIIDQLARYTGLSKTYIEESNLRVGIRQFTKELLRRQHRTVGRLDSRFEGIDATAVGDTSEYDPSYAAIYGPFTAALNDYVRRELLYRNDLPYEILTGRVRPWKWKSKGQGYVNVAETLRQAMSKNHYLRVFIANGYFDLATPFFATEYTVHHLRLDPTLRKNLTLAYFEAGHMMYIHKPSLRKLTRDVARFVKETLSQPANVIN